MTDSLGKAAASCSEQWKALFKRIKVWSPTLELMYLFRVQFAVDQQALLISWANGGKAARCSGSEKDTAFFLWLRKYWAHVPLAASRPGRYSEFGGRIKVSGAPSQHVFPHDSHQTEEWALRPSSDTHRIHVTWLYSVTILPNKSLEKILSSGSSSMLPR